MNRPTMKQRLIYQLKLSGKLERDNKKLIKINVWLMLYSMFTTCMLIAALLFAGYL